jgi:translation initiation factor 2 subunit 1
MQELYKQVGWPLYRIFGHAFDAFKVMVADDGDAIFKRLEEDRGAALDVLNPQV